MLGQGTEAHAGVGHGSSRRPIKSSFLPLPLGLLPLHSLSKHTRRHPLGTAVTLLHAVWCWPNQVRISIRLMVTPSSTRCWTGSQWKVSR